MAKEVVQGIDIPLVSQLAKELGQEFIDNLKAPSVVVSQPHEGAVFISSLDGNWSSWHGQVVACYYHPTRPHTATTVGKLGTKQSKAEAGSWAISIQTRAMFGNKTHYNTL